jgi:serine/threonine protein kinase
MTKKSKRSNRFKSSKKVINSTTAFLSLSKKTLKSKRTKVIGEGGFGCVLKPNITCKLRNGQKIPSNQKFISKLMDREDFEDEFKDVQSVKAIIKGIPNYNKYFLVDIHQCKPDTYNSGEIDAIKRDCKYFKDKTKQELSEMNTLIMPYGGNRSDHAIEEIMNQKDNLVKFAATFAIFFEKAILEMNRRNVYHCDIKLQNILYQKNKLMLIDWGFSYIHDDNVASAFHVPNKFCRYPLHFNMPITVCLFGENIFSAIQRKLHSEGTSVDFVKVARYAWEIVKTSRKGHYELIVDNYNFLKPSNYKDSFDEFAIKIYKDVLQKYTNSEKDFDSYRYFKECYLPNVDIYGIIICYVSFMDITNNNKNSSFLFSAISNYLKPYDKREILNLLKKISI